ncbi:AbiH family protein [Pedobacter ginsengisoli]|uniref:AbiH family protein n=1 Tax=Pedobacter ginsengisoli TaxID=363852 RepID=UPI00254CC7E9|nr:AbiH family protein [Pedobacter ginsengisoli]
MNQKIPINRLILLGNGFDLAHGLKTTYNDFIIWYLVQAMEKASMHLEYKDGLMTINCPHFYAINSLYNQGLDKVPDFVNYFYHHGFSHMISEAGLKFQGWQNIYQNPFKFNLRSDLLSTLLTSCSNANWVDIENTFYDKLKDVLKHENPQQKEKEIADLNQSFQIIIYMLEAYLSTLDGSTNVAGYETIINSCFEPDEFVGLTNEDVNGTIDQTMILNFNYTSTIRNYVDDQTNDQSRITLNYIHGKLGDEKNRPIFGFGDELDQDYASFELAKTKGIFEYIKSFWYFKTSNYHNLIRFIDSAPYQIYILGHSCGLSDRTMLNMVFENNNCKSIKIFYHQNEHFNNYTPLTQEIARHFKDKQDMRRKIVPFDKSSPMPQVLLDQ